MTCVELERGLQECVEGSPTPEQQAHLNSCPTCSGLLSDLNAIASQAKSISATEEPSPAVWNELEVRLRSEGLIRRSDPTYAPVRDFRPSWLQRWRATWLVPVAAALAIVAVVKLYHPVRVDSDTSVLKKAAIQENVQNPKVTRPLSAEDQQWLNTVADRPPAQLARFRSDLEEANAFIEDTQQSLQRDPNDLYMQQMLIDAYEQKQMLYELAVDNSSQ